MRGKKPSPVACQPSLTNRSSHPYFSSSVGGPIRATKKKKAETWHKKKSVGQMSTCVGIGPCCPHIWAGRWTLMQLCESASASSAVALYFVFLSNVLLKKTCFLIHTFIIDFFVYINIFFYLF